MRPIPFRGQTGTLLPGSGGVPGYVALVAPLPVWTDGDVCVSCWRPSWRERLSALVFGRVWLSVLAGRTQPAVAVGACREFFEGADAHP